MTHGSLFSGIGGFDLGFERIGIQTVWQVEIDEFCQKVLAKHFPQAKRFRDIKQVGVQNLEKVDIITGGFPCSDISVAGKKRGLAGEKSGLWFEMFRVCSELRPRYIVIENVANLVRLGLDRVLANLASIGYDAEWTNILACDIGACHRRKRIWIVAYPNCQWKLQSGGIAKNERERIGNSSENVSYSGNDRIVERKRELSEDKQISGGGFNQRIREAFDEGREWWGTEPGVGRLADEVPDRVAKLRALGNAVVPQIPEIIGKLLLEHHLKQEL